jgi:uncharacterized protein YlxW (UPF0749 family)
MTFVGKILVVVLMVFAILFLAMSTVVFTTSTNWKARTVALREEITKKDDALRRLQAELQTQKANLGSAQQAFEKDKSDFTKQIKSLSDENVRRQEEITKQRTAIETALENVQSTSKEAEARIAEATKLRELLTEVQRQANEFKLQKTDLDQQIVLLKRDLEVASANNSNLRNSVTVLQSNLKKAGLESDPNKLNGLAVPPDVEGQVLKVDAKNTTIEISIGSNDGLVPGHELDVYRVSPSPEYIGKVRIVETDPNRSTARVIGKTLYGKKIQEGDNVTTKIRPRG